MKRLNTGVDGLDNILSGGLPAGQMYLLEGDPGTGKTTLAMQFIKAGIERGERAMYITLSEPASELQGSAQSHGWDIESIPISEFVPEEASFSADQQYTVFHPSEVELASTIQRLTAEIEKLNPHRLVIDSLSELRLLASDAMRYRRQLLALKQFFSGRQNTVLMLDDLTGETRDLQLQSIAHGVIRLEKLPRSYGSTRRRVEILKLRGSSFREGFHDYTIQHGGLVVYPRLVAAEHNQNFTTERVHSGNESLDAMFGGGIARGSSTLITGPAGCGKSTLAMQYAHAAAQRGDRAVVYAFDEVLRTAKERAKMLGMDLDPLLESGCLCMSQVDPAELSPGQFIAQIRSEVEERNTRLVIIDSLNGLLHSMPGERDVILQLHELLAYLNQNGVVTIVILTQHGLIGTVQAQLDVSYLADTVILLRYFEVSGSIRQVISVVKQRVGKHERTLRELHFGRGGIQIGEPLYGLQGVLTGVPQLLDSDPSAVLLQREGEENDS